MKYFNLLFLLIPLACIPCDLRAPQALFPDGNGPSRRDLMEAMREKGYLLLVYAASDSSCAGHYRRWAESLSRQSGRRLRVEARPDHAVSPGELAANALLLVGTPTSNSALARLLPHLPLKTGSDGLRFDQYHFRDSSTVFSLGLFPNPLNPRLPVLLHTGLSDATVLQFLERQGQGSGRGFPGGDNPGYAVYQEGRRILMGAFEDGSWALSSLIRFDFSAPPREVYRSERFSLRACGGTLPPPLVGYLGQRAEAESRKLEAFTGRTLPKKTISWHLYPTAEVKGLMLNNTDQVQVDFSSGEVHLAADSLLGIPATAAAQTATLRQLMGAPALPVLETGLCLYLNGDDWQGAGTLSWARRLHLANALLPLAELLDEQAAETGSSLVRECLAASLVAFLIESWGKEEFLARYPTWTPRPEEMPSLEAGWKAFLQAQAPPAVSGRPAGAKAMPLLRGFNFTHEGYQIYNGYGSGLSSQALRRLGQLNVNAVAIVPYSWMGQPATPSPIPVVSGPGSENDESVVRTLREARQQGLVTMLKPQLWVGRGSWPGDIGMATDAEWQLFFQYYRKWIMHYAMVAEIHGADLFCIGTELSKASLEREADWRRLIADVRCLYSGPLTYAANWGKEFENLAFWDLLDFAGLDCYYPLSRDTFAGREALQEGFASITQRMEGVARKSGKPLLLTEIGFSSVSSPWIMPHSDGEERPYNEAHQRLCYEITLEGLAGKPWLQGLFWWKWPTNPEHRGRQDGKGFPPNGKAAEQALQEPGWGLEK